MIKSHFFYYFVGGLAAFFLLSAPLGCGQDPGLYDEELFAFDNHDGNEANAIGAKDSEDFDLGADESSDFGVRPLGPYGFYGFGYPLYDYYTRPLPIAVPISPVASLVDYVHPFYAHLYLNPWFDDDDGFHFKFDDDDGLRFKFDDDDS